MPAYQIDLRTPKGSQTFITEDLEGEVAKVRLKSFVDIITPLRDFVLDIRPLDSSKKEQPENVPTSQVECLYTPDQICPLGEDQAPESCLHCDGRGRETT